MVRVAFGRCVLAGAVLLLAMSTASSKTAEWTVLVYMNAKNNLEPDALTNFEEIAKVGSTPSVNVIVELGRPNHPEPQQGTDWSGVLRFRVTKSQAPSLDAAVQDLRSDAKLSDLGSKDALSDFVNWSIDRYPAHHYMLVIWNHGQGWRFQAAEDRSVREQSARSANSLVQTPDAAKELLQKTPSVGGYRTVSYDQTTGHFLFNSDVEAVANEASARIGRKLDVIGFDACLMSMFETAYAFRDAAELLVGSEELEPEAGWNYEPVIAALKANPKLSGLELSGAVIEAYRARNGDYRETTMSVVSLRGIRSVADSISTLADALAVNQNSERNNIAAARRKVVAYGTDDLSIDFLAFLRAFGGFSHDKSLLAKVSAAESSIQAMILRKYASRTNRSEKGSNGIAIYFPSQLSVFNADPYHSGYIKNNSDHIVDFVAKERWADFLASYLQ